jgi:hypothetical protein
MAQSRRISQGASVGPPAEAPAGTPAATPMTDHSFTLQAVMDLKGTVASLATKVDRLIEDVGKQGDKIDTVQHQISFVRGAVWVIGGLLAIALAAAAIYVRLAASRGH